MNRTLEEVKTRVEGPPHNIQPFLIMYDKSFQEWNKMNESEQVTVIEILNKHCRLVKKAFARTKPLISRAEDEREILILGLISAIGRDTARDYQILSNVNQMALEITEKLRTDLKTIKDNFSQQIEPVFKEFENLMNRIKNNVSLMIDESQSYNTLFDEE